MASALPLLLVGGAALLLMGRKKKADAAAAAEAEAEEEEYEDEEEEDDAFNLDVPPEKPKPEGYEEATEEELDAGPMDEGVAGEMDPVARCNKFIDQIWVDTDADDELPIRPVVVEESILPALRGFLRKKADEKGSFLTEPDVLPVALIVGMEAVAPGCQWEVGQDFAWRYAGGLPITGRPLEVMKSLGQLALAVRDEVNIEKGFVKVAKFVPIDDDDGGGGGGFDPHGIAGG